MFPILTTIPSVHATIIGIGLAFFSAYFMYASPKIKDADRKLKSAIEKSKEISSWGSYLGAGDSSIIVNGELDWHDKSKGLFDDAIRLVDCLDRQNFDIFSSTGEQYTIDLIEKTTDNLIELFYIFFKYYPLNGVHIVINKTQSHSPKHDIWDSQRYEDIYWRMDYLNYIWQGESKEKLIKLFQIRENLEAYKNQQALSLSVQQARDREESIEDKDRVTQFIMQSEARYRSPRNRYLNLLTSFFSTVNEYSDQVLAPLQEAIINFEKYTADFNLKKYTRVALITTIIILMSGIIIPIVLLNILTKINYIDHSYLLSFFEYFILTISFLPYFIFIGYFLNKINSSIL